MATNKNKDRDSKRKASAAPSGARLNTTSAGRKNAKAKAKEAMEKNSRYPSVSGPFKPRTSGASGMGAKKK